MEWLQSNWMALCGTLALGVQFARAIAKMTKTTKDDAIVEKIAVFLGYFIGKDAK
jgi:hypothetical protein